MKFAFLTVLLFFVLVPYSAVCAQAPGKFVPADGKVLLFIGQDRNSMDNYIQSTRVIPAGFMFYSSIQKLDGMERPVDNGGGVQDLKYIAQYYQSSIQIGLYLVDALDDIIAGTYDQNIDKLAAWFKKANRPIFLRIGYEFDNPANHYEPTKYIQAFRYIVYKLTRAGVNNVAYVWHSYAGGGAAYPPIAWYPGDNYVDWIAISYFSPNNIENMNEVAIIAEDLNKPFMIAESSSIKFPTTNGEHTWQRWFEFIFKYIDQTNVQAFCYINNNWDQFPMFAAEQWGDARIEANKEITTRWLNKIKQEKFLNTSPKLFEQMGYMK